MAVDDTLGCFVPGPPVELDGAADGPLAGLTLAVKDVFDMAGHTTGCGNPTWTRTHAPADATASAVSRLLAAGARIIGRTVCDELAFSLAGENHHFGTPKNSAAPGRIPGGSSSGSASAVAGGVADIGLGTDTGGSVRVPASFCGLYGIRASHGAIPLDRCLPLAPSFDCVGWLARDAKTLARVGAVMLPPGDARPLHRVLVAEDALAMLADGALASLAPALTAVAKLWGEPARFTLAPEGLSAWVRVFRTLQMGEIWATHGGWVRAHNPEFGPGVRERFEAAADVQPAQVAAALAERARIVARLSWLIQPGTAVLLPTSPGSAPLLATPAAAMDAHRLSLQQLTAPAGLGRLPQVTMPFGKEDGCPLGLSLLGAPGQDRSLLDAATALSAALGR